MIQSKTLKTIIKIVLFILLLWFIISLTKNWLKPTIIKVLGGYTQKEMKTTIDTLDIKYNDIYTKYKEIETKGIIDTVPIYIYKDKVTKKQPTITSSHKGEVLLSKPREPQLKQYTTTINDSILDGKIETTVSIFDCKITSQTFKYVPKIPYIREKIVTVVETKEVTLSDKPKSYIGIGLDVNTINQVTPQSLYLTKKKWLYKAGFSKSLNNQYPNTITVGVAKLF